GGTLVGAHGHDDCALLGGQVFVDFRHGGTLQERCCTWSLRTPKQCKCIFGKSDSSDIRIRIFSIHNYSDTSSEVIVNLIAISRLLSNSFPFESKHSLSINRTLAEVYSIARVKFRFRNSVCKNKKISFLTESGTFSWLSGKSHRSILFE
ncbi:MAG: hypothetical protein M3Y65_16150, partial [Pseudomonadota bacterium]|nr:hypothetical protein [Pseudomonadota bacterium]